MRSGLTAEEISCWKRREGSDNVLAIVKTIAAKNKEIASTILKLIPRSEGDKPLAIF
jgi:hypothetical protein